MQRGVSDTLLSFPGLAPARSNNCKDGVRNENKVDVTAYRCYPIRALRSGNMQRRVSKVVHNVDVGASGVDQQLDTLTALGKSGEMQKSISVVASATAKRGIGEQTLRLLESLSSANKQASRGQGTA